MKQILGQFILLRQVGLNQAQIMQQLHINHATFKALLTEAGSLSETMLTLRIARDALIKVIYTADEPEYIVKASATLVKLASLQHEIAQTEQTQDPDILLSDIFEIVD